MKPIVFMFSGQGSHYYHMGRELYERQPIFNYWMQKGDALFKAITGSSIIAELYHEQYKKSDAFTRTLLTHPAIFIVGHALGQVLLAQNIIPDYVLGTSLGEFTAAVFAGIMPFENALQAIITQAQMLEQNCLPGSMLAILHEPAFYNNNLFLQQNSELAATNFYSHFVISGKQASIKEVEMFLKEKNISFQALAVNQGFHSSLIDPAAPDYFNFIRQQSLRFPTLPFISAAQAKNVTTLSNTHFWDIIRVPIQFQATIQALETKNNYFYLDVGPTGTLATFVKYNLMTASASKTFALLTPFSQDSSNLTKLPDFLRS